MKYRPLGSTGLQVSELGFGCGATAGLMTSADHSLQLTAVRRALDYGITYFDTAAAYGNGQSEENLGRALHDLGATPVIATKVTLQWEDLGDIRSAVRRSIESSLRRLRRDRLDVVHLHNRVGKKRSAKSDYGSGALLSVEDIVGEAGVSETLCDLQRAGAIGVMGCCAFGGEHAAVEGMIDAGNFRSVLVNYSLLNASAIRPTSMADATYDYKMVGSRAADAGMGIVALRVLEAGLLTGPLPMQARSDVPSRFRAVFEGMAALSIAETGTSDFAELAIRYVLSNAMISTALIGFSDVKQIDAAVAHVRRGVLPSEVLTQLEFIVNAGGR